MKIIEVRALASLALQHPKRHCFLEQEMKGRYNALFAELYVFMECKNMELLHARIKVVK